MLRNAEPIGENKTIGDANGYKDKAMKHHACAW